jgi:Domain of unknown function (DUF1816)
MFESALVVNLILLLAVALMGQILLEASKQAWQRRDLLGEDASAWGWWIELQTAQPQCLYYFGPFAKVAEAENSKLGYIQDLQEEGAQNITVKVKWCKPEQLTILRDEPSLVSGMVPQ